MARIDIVRFLGELAFLLALAACSNQAIPTGLLAKGFDDPAAIAPARGIETTSVVECTSRVTTLASAGAAPVLDITSRIVRILRWR